MGEISSRLNERPLGTLPSNTEQNPKVFAKAMITRSGARARDEPVIQEVTTEGVVKQPAVDGEEQVDEEIQMESLPARVHQRRNPASTAQAEKQSKPPLRVYKPKFPYPRRLLMDRDEEQNSKFLELLKKLHLNVPFLEALTQMLKYTKFLKDILTNKQKLAEVSFVPLNAGCSAILQSKLHEKIADPGSFTILGILGDDTFIFPVDFFILDMNEDDSVPLIIGRPFLDTAQALIDVRDGKLILGVGDENVMFDVR
ncbi:uncharacterized protein LOC143541109 [Bidens hawaiensis]|uniref:uncharacterized protein LOC143541109 n=1 Tax=Bidens hawaiensis TaxID=980011 RepID=UPI00404A4BA5